ncbi:MAG TPA: protein translocase subunit SecF [Candidatus Limnocylindrales bacterium]|nr:protein translocase subunit SecF [Candidatus Limnocylindrales bacterium]
MFELIKPDTRIDFMKLRPYAFAFSAVLTVLGLIVLFARGGPNYGIDFTGGLLLHVGVDPSVTISEMRAAVDELGEAAEGASVQDFGNQPGEYLLRLAVTDESLAQGTGQQIKEKLAAKFADKSFRDLRTEMVGPKVGADLRQRGILSVLASTVIMGIYIAFRFDLRFGVGAAVALFHDVLVTVSALALANFEVDLTVVAALLTCVGYSVNDTVVVSDRIRENMFESPKEDLRHLINRSLNETLSRTVLTGGTTFMVLVVLFFIGGGVIHAFAYTLIVGLLIGTYSSIFIASPIVELWKGGAPSQGKA